jgi:hypothetical protein
VNKCWRRKKGAGTHSLTAGKIGSSFCLCIKNEKRKEFVDIGLPYCDNMAGIRTLNNIHSPKLYL